MRKLVVAVLGAALLAPTGVGADGESPPGISCYRDPETGVFHQTPDPMSPPCVAHFEGDNGGETWRGVTEHEVRVVITVDIGTYSGEPTPAAGIYDLAAPPKPPCQESLPNLDECDHVLVRSARALLESFNSVWQTYNRRVHGFMHFTGASSPQERAADAAHQLAAVEPFAVLDHGVFYGHNDSYASAAADLGMMVFASPTALSDDVYTDGAPYIWGFWPDTSDRADIYVSYICQNVAPFPVTHSGGPGGAGGFNGEPRRFGLYYTTDPDARHLHDLRVRVRQGLAECGVSWEAEGTFPQEGFVINNRDPGVAQLQALEKFRSQEVTTILWLGGVEGKFTHLAAAAGYLPEVIFAGDGNLDGRANGRFQDPLVWANAWGPTFDIREDAISDTWGAQAVVEAKPDATDDEQVYGSMLYRDFFMLFYAIQLSGPGLNPSNVEDGLRAVPPNESDDAYQAACSFPKGEYTCVDDAMEVWWDPAGLAPGTTAPGCMRAVYGGRRTLPWEWPGMDRVFSSADDPCIGNGRTYKMRPL